MRAAPRIALGCVAALALAGCDAGNKEGVNKPGGPSLFLSSPRMDQVLTPEPKKDDAGKAIEPRVWPVQVMIDLRDYVVGPAKKGPDGAYVEGSGQHVHVILDDEPYLAIYDVSKPVVLDVKAEGTHVVRAFPSAGPADRSGKKWHEAWKNPGAFAWVKFHVGKKGGPLADFDGSRPTLTYSRPKGDYVLGDADAKILFPLMVDFWLSNAKLGEFDHRLRIAVDGTPLTVNDPRNSAQKVPDLFEWKPYFVERDLAAGEHTVVVELLDRDGNVVEGPFNRTERKVRLTPAK